MAAGIQGKMKSPAGVTAGDFRLGAGRRLGVPLVRGALRNTGGVEPEVGDHEVRRSTTAFALGDREGDLGLARPGLDLLAAHGDRVLLLAGGAVVGRDHQAVELDRLRALVDNSGAEAVAARTEVDQVGLGAGASGAAVDALRLGGLLRRRRRGWG